MRRLRMTVVVLGVVLARGPAAFADASRTPAPATAPASSPPPAPAAGTSGPASSPPPAPAAGAPGLASSSLPPPPASPPALAPTPAHAGLAVVALAGVADAAWPLARSVYADPTLRPGAVDDAHARVLCGEVPAPTAAPELRDLSDTVAALRGDDAPTRALLDGIARRFALRAVVVVRSDAGHPTARLYLADTGAFDAAAYSPDNPQVRRPAGTRPPARSTASSAPLRRLRRPALRPLPRGPRRRAPRPGDARGPPKRGARERVAPLLRIRVVLGGRGGCGARGGRGLLRDAGQRPFHDPS